GRPLIGGAQEQRKRRADALLGAAILESGMTAAAGDAERAAVDAGAEWTERTAGESVHGELAVGTGKVQQGGSPNPPRVRHGAPRNGCLSPRPPARRRRAGPGEPAGPGRRRRWAHTRRRPVPAPL